MSWRCQRYDARRQVIARRGNSSKLNLAQDGISPRRNNMNNMKNMMRALIAGLLFGAMGAASATDYNFGQVPIPAHGYNSRPLPALYSDTATFYLGNWIEPNGSEYQYADSVTIVVQGEWTYGVCSGRAGCGGAIPVLHTTMHAAVLMANDGAGHLLPALDIHGN